MFRSGEAVAHGTSTNAISLHELYPIWLFSYLQNGITSEEESLNQFPSATMLNKASVSCTACSLG